MTHTISDDIRRLLACGISSPQKLLTDLLNLTASYYGDAYFLDTKSREKKLYKEIKNVDTLKYNFQVNYTHLNSQMCFLSPIVCEKLLGHFLVCSYHVYTDKDIELLSWVSHIVTVVSSQIHNFEKESHDNAKSTIGSLSYTELSAALCIFKELPDDNLLVMGKFADTNGFSRSIVSNTVRKFESSGLIETRSLGVKGTYIRIINEKLIEELGKLRV